LILRLLREESGYSLVEVLASILILALAILPMVGMFDMGLNGATRGSNYDKARALAKKQLEQAQSLPYISVRDDFPNAPCTFNDSGLCAAQDLSIPAEDPADADGLDDEYDTFRYAISKQYVEPSGNDFIPTPDDGIPGNNDTGLMQVTVEVGWGGDGFDDTTYRATTIKAR
jgi:hypothetical protein